MSESNARCNSAPIHRFVTWFCCGYVRLPVRSVWHRIHSSQCISIDLIVSEIRRFGRWGFVEIQVFLLPKWQELQLGCGVMFEQAPLRGKKIVPMPRYSVRWTTKFGQLDSSEIRLTSHVQVGQFVKIRGRHTRMAMQIHRRQSSEFDEDATSANNNQ